MNRQLWSDAISNLGSEVLEPHMERKMRISPGWGVDIVSEGGSTVNQKPVQYKWWIVMAIVAVLLIAGIVIAIVLGGGPDTPVIEEPRQSPIGVYYYDTAEGEYVLTLSDGNVFTIAGPNLNKSGKCVVTDNGIELDFVRDEDGTGTITIDGTELTLQYKDKTMRFLEKKTFKVSFHVNGGSAVETVKYSTRLCASTPMPLPVRSSSRVDRMTSSSVS